MFRKVCFFLTQKTATQRGICCEVKHFVLDNWYQVLCACRLQCMKIGFI